MSHLLCAGDVQPKQSCCQRISLLLSSLMLFVLYLEPAHVQGCAANGTIILIEITLDNSSLRVDRTKHRRLQQNEDKNLKSNPLLSTIPKISITPCITFLFERKKRNKYATLYNMHACLVHYCPDVLCVFLYRDVKSGHVIFVASTIAKCILRTGLFCCDCSFNQYRYRETAVLDIPRMSILSFAYAFHPSCAFAS